MSNPTQEEEAAGLVAGTVIDGRYKIVRCIGQGGNGLVYEVEHVRTGRKLALKALIQEAAMPGRLEQEARATSLISSSHATRITDMGTAKETGPYLVMELLEGQSLRALLDDAGQLPLELVVNITLQVCECLDEAHKLGIIHRDLKPENIFLSPSPWPGQYDVKVLDFGVVKISSDGPIPQSSLTRTGSTVGTPYYMSLEQLRNASTVDQRADVYALGVVAYESLSGKKPFMADTIGDLVYALCSGPATPIGRLRPDLPADVAETIMRALSMNKEDRPKSMADLAVAILPHGNAAFGLWVRVDGKQPALARKMQVVSRNAVPTPSAANKLDPAAPIVPAPPKPAGPPPPPAPPRAKPGAVPAPPSAPSAAGPSAWTDAALGGGPTPGAIAPPIAGIAAPVTDPETSRMPESGPLPPPVSSGGAGLAPPSAPVPPSRRRRDTPTEMFANKPAEDDDDEPDRSGDRDTPTRAITAEMIEEQRKKRALGAAIVDEPTGLLPQIKDGGFPQIGARPQVPVIGDKPSHLQTTSKLDVAFMATMPAAPVRTMAIPTFGAPPLGLEGQSPLQPMPPMAPMAPVDDAAFKPGWQRSLDQALVSLGRVVDRGLANYREAPRKTQVLVIVSAGSVGAFVVVLILFLLIR